MSNELYHYGIKNQQWGVRRYQYEDGTLTPEGKARYRKSFGQRVKDDWFQEAENFNGGRTVKQTVKKTVFTTLASTGAATAAGVLGVFGGAAIGGIPGAIVVAGGEIASAALSALSGINAGLGITAAVRKNMMNKGTIASISGKNNKERSK